MTSARIALATIGLVSILTLFTCHKTQNPSLIVRKAPHPYRFLEAEMNRRGLEFAHDAQVMSVSSDNIELPDDLLRARALFIKALPKPPDSIPYDYQYERTENALEFIDNGQWQQAVDQVIIDIPRDATPLNSAIFCLGSIKLGDLKTARRFAPLLPPYNENYANFASHRKDIDDQNDRSTFDSNLPCKIHSMRELEALCWFILAFEFPNQYPLSNSKSELNSARNAVLLAPNIAGYRYQYSKVLYKQQFYKAALEQAYIAQQLASGYLKESCAELLSMIGNTDVRLVKPFFYLANPKLHAPGKQ